VLVAVEEAGEVPVQQVVQPAVRQRQAVHPQPEAHPQPDRLPREAHPQVARREGEGREEEGLLLNPLPDLR
jgi:hypothetical protein